MARTTKKKEAGTVVTRAEKKDAAKGIIRELLAVKPYRHNELIDETAMLYTERFSGEDTENINDVKGRVGSVLDIMKKEGDVAYEGGMYALKARMPMIQEPNQAKEQTANTEEKPQEKTVKKTSRAKGKKAEESTEKEDAQEGKTPAKKTAKKVTKQAERRESKEKEILPVAQGEASTALETVTQSIKEQQTKNLKTAKKEKPAKKTAKVVKTEDAVLPVAEETQGKATKKTTRNKKKQAPMVALNGENASQTPMGTPMESVSAENTPEKAVTSVPAPILLEEKAIEKTENAQKPTQDNVQEEPRTDTPTQAANPPIIKEKGEVATKGVVMDMSFLFGDVKSKGEKAEKKAEPKGEKKPEISVEEKPSAEETATEAVTTEVAETAVKEIAPQTKVKPQAEKTKEEKPQVRKPLSPKVTAEQPAQTSDRPQEKKENRQMVARKNVRARIQTPQRQPITADEKLRDAFLKKIRSLGGDYFEYYSVYLLERYSLRNGRRLEGLKITGGEHDGGIDGEIELTDKMGFRETIYIQSKNWDPDKGDEKLWVVGETLLQQFIGACMCRRAKDGKQHTRGIFVTTSRFTPEAKRLLDDMSDVIVGYDGNDLYETAKECQFGLLYENGNWKLDEQLLSGAKAFFHMF